MQVKCLSALYCVLRTVQYARGGNCVVRSIGFVRRIKRRQVPELKINSAKCVDGYSGASFTTAVVISHD